MDKKLKIAADKIKMPEDMKARIINACEAAEKKRPDTSDNDGYIDVVSSSERVNPGSRIIRTISTVAACAVLVGGLGAAGVFLHNQRSAHIPGAGMIDETECKSLTFVDFSTLEYRFDAGDGKYGKYTAETYAKLSDFLNKFDWGAPVEKPEGRDIDADVEEPVYDIRWTRGNTPPVECDLHISNDGYVSYQESMMDFETGGQMPLTENSKWYKVDFDAFDRGVQAILAEETTESPFTDILNTAFGAFPFINSGLYETTNEKIEKMIEIYNSQMWTECDCPDKFIDFDLTEPSRDYFTVLCGTGDNITYLMTTYDGYTCVYSEKYINEEADPEKSDKKYYNCNDTGFGEKLLEVYDYVGNDNVEEGAQDMADYNRIVDFFNSYDSGALVVWCDENGGLNKQDLDNDQFQTVKNYFSEHEVKDIVPNTFGRIEGKKWNDEFGFSQIQLYDREKQEHTILYISKDSSLIAVNRSSNSAMEENVTLYSAEGLEALQFIRNFAE